MENANKMKQAIDYMYSYKDEFTLLLLKSRGSSLENFCEDLVKLYENLNQDMVSVENREITNDIYFDHYSLHMFIHLEIAAILELIKHDLPYEQAIKQAETIAVFFYSIWNYKCSRWYDTLSCSVKYNHTIL